MTLCSTALCSKDIVKFFIVSLLQSISNCKRVLTNFILPTDLPKYFVTGNGTDQLQSKCASRLHSGIPDEVLQFYLLCPNLPGHMNWIPKFSLLYWYWCSNGLGLETCSLLSHPGSIVSFPKSVNAITVICSQPCKCYPPVSICNWDPLLYYPYIESHWHVG